MTPLLFRFTAVNSVAGVPGPTATTRAFAIDRLTAAPTDAQRLFLSCAVVAADGSVRTGVSTPAKVVEIPHARGGQMLTVFRVEAGVVQMQKRDGTWVASIPMYSWESGAFDLALIARRLGGRLSADSVRTLEIVADR